jgi:hypothetical protein
MSEFKFTCPVCGQHIAADASGSGAQIECPTCFQRIIIPQAPRPDSRYILSATQYIKPPPLTELQSIAPAPVPTRASPVPWIVGIVVLAVAAAAVAGFLGRRSRSQAGTESPPATHAEVRPAPHKAWTLELGDRPIPEGRVTGKIHNRTFTCDRAVLVNGTLALRKGRLAPSDLAVNVYLSATNAEVLKGARFDIEPNSTNAAPRVALRWGEGDLRVSQMFTNGYAMKLEISGVTDSNVTGRIYLCTPDATKSFVAGAFTADITNMAYPRARF